MAGRGWLLLLQNRNLPRCRWHATNPRGAPCARWESASGQLQHFFDDALVPGTVGVQPDLLCQVEPFPTTTDLKPYTPESVRGWTVERYQVDSSAAHN